MTVMEAPHPDIPRTEGEVFQTAMRGQSDYYVASGHLLEPECNEMRLSSRVKSSRIMETYEAAPRAVRHLVSNLIQEPTYVVGHLADTHTDDFCVLSVKTPARVKVK